MRPAGSAPLQASLSVGSAGAPGHKMWGAFGGFDEKRRGRSFFVDIQGVFRNDAPYRAACAVDCGAGSGSSGSVYRMFWCFVA